MGTPRFNLSIWAPMILTGFMSFIGAAVSIGAFAVHVEHRFTVLEVSLSELKSEIKSRTFPTASVAKERDNQILASRRNADARDKK